jgi:hypothetical protein
VIPLAATSTATMSTGFWDFFPPALLAAVLAAIVAVALRLLQSHAEERARVRILYAEAYQWYSAYKEMPYAIRRRNPDEPAAERLRLSETIREIQARLDHFQTWTFLEDEQVGVAYGDLLRELRRVAGMSMHDAWIEPGTTTDAGMNMKPGRVDLSDLTPFENTFNAAVRRALAPRWRRRQFTR